MITLVVAAEAIVSKAYPGSMHQYTSAQMVYLNITLAQTEPANAGWEHAPVYSTMDTFSADSHP